MPKLYPLLAAVPFALAVTGLPAQAAVHGTPTAAVAKLKVTPATGPVGTKVTVAAGARAALHSTVTVTLNDIGSQNPGPTICTVKITTSAQETTWHCSGMIPGRLGTGEKFIDGNNPKFLGSFEFDVT